LLEGFSNGGTSNIKEVSGLSSVKLDNVHGRHSESSSVNEATNVSSDVDVVKIPLGGGSFSRVIGRGVFLSEDVLLSVEGVAINSDLGVSSEEFVIGSHDEGVDLDHIAITSVEGVEDSLEHVGDLGNFSRNAKSFSSQNHLGFGDNTFFSNRKFEDLIGSLFSDVFDVHTSSSGVDESRALSSSVQSARKVELGCNTKLLNNVNSVARESGGSRLLGDKSVSEHFTGNALNLIGSINDVYSSFEARVECSESTSSGKYLRFDDVFGALREFRADGTGLFGSEGDSTNGNRDLVGFEHSSSLVFVELKSSHGN
jgi:hypothetical protein